MQNRRSSSLAFAVHMAAIALTSGAVLAQGAPPAPPVQVAAPLAKRVTNWDEYTGRFEASEQVEVRARVSGFSVLFPPANPATTA